MSIVVAALSFIGAAGTLLVALPLVKQNAGLSALQSGMLTIGYLVAILSTIRVGEKLLERMGARNPMLMGCASTAAGILLTTFTFLVGGQHMIVAFVGFTLLRRRRKSAADVVDPPEDDL